MAKKTYDMLLKVMLIGDSGVGKTCLLFRYCDDSYTDTFISTIGIDFKVKTVDIDGKRIKMQIWDTAGQERFENITTNYYRGAMGILLVYDVTEQRSFENINKWLHRIHQHAQDNVCKILVANKCDDNLRRVVPKASGASIAKTHKIPFYECSARSGENVLEAFEDLAVTIIGRINAGGAEIYAPKPQSARKLQETVNLGGRHSGVSCCQR